jgi:hypothetical protein
VYGESREALFAEGRLPGIDADPNAESAAIRPRVRRQRTLSLDGGGHGVLRTAECDEERIALPIDDLAAMEVECPSKERPVIREHALVVIAQRFEQLRRTLDVCEEKGDGAARQFRHDRIKVLRAPTGVTSVAFDADHTLRVSEAIGGSAKPVQKMHRKRKLLQS